jgi:hypothetical protein
MMGARGRGSNRFALDLTRRRGDGARVHRRIPSSRPPAGEDWFERSEITSKAIADFERTAATPDLRSRSATRRTPPPTGVEIQCGRGSAGSQRLLAMNCEVATEPRCR